MKEFFYMLPPSPLHIISVDSVDSTHLYAKRNLKDINCHTLISTLEQTNGIGRRGGVWQTPKGNFAGTFVLNNIRIEQVDISKLSLVVACSLSSYFKNENFYDFSIKWPNDIYDKAFKAKLGGILIEREDQILLISIGLNKISSPSAPHYPTTSLKDLKGHQLLKRWNENVLFSYIWQDIQTFQKSGLEPFINIWEENCGHMNKKIELFDGRKGIFLGLQKNGDARLSS